MSTAESATSCHERATGRVARFELITLFGVLLEVGNQVVPVAMSARVGVGNVLCIPVFALLQATESHLGTRDVLLGVL